MALIDWNDTLSVKIESIDKEHQKLISMINEFYDNVKEESNTELIARLIRKMKEYSQFHFNTEESYMRLYNFSGYEEHKKEHNEFIEKVISLEERFSSGKMVISFEITNFLKQWIKRHIMKTDKKYIDFFIKNGIK